MGVSFRCGLWHNTQFIVLGSFSSLGDKGHAQEYKEGACYLLFAFVSSYSCILNSFADKDSFGILHSSKLNYLIFHRLKSNRLWTACPCQRSEQFPAPAVVYEQSSNATLFRVICNSRTRMQPRPVQQGLDLSFHWQISWNCAKASQGHYFQNN